MKKKILLVQRYYMHYRKELIGYLNESMSDYEICVAYTGDSTQLEGARGEMVFKADKRKYRLFGKTYDINISTDLVSYIKKSKKDYEFVIVEGTTNIINNIFVVPHLILNNFPYVWWDAGRRRFSQKNLARRIADPFIDYFMKKSKACIAYSSVAREYFIERGVKAEQIFTCHNTLNVSHFDNVLKNIPVMELECLHNQLAPYGEKIILYVGALEKRKRVQDLIDAFNTPEISGKSKLVIIGDGPDRSNLELHVKVNSINGIQFLGSIIDGSIKYYAICDLFVLPSEGGLALNQAMICSKPVIASSADGTEVDLVEHGKNGFLFNENDIFGLRELLQASLLQDAYEMGLQSRLVIDEKINERAFTNEFRNMIEYLLRG